MKKFKVGLQLYSIRDDMEKDMDAALAKVKEMGYDYVEFAGYFGKTAEEVKALLDKHGLKCISVHQAPQLFFDEGQKAIDFLKVIGAEYCAIPWYEIDKQDWNDTITKFTQLGKDMKANGIQLLYHNHDFEFKKRDGEYLIDKLYSDIPSDLLHPEFDTCWVRYAGEDPCKYIEKYKGEVQVLHLKDFVCSENASGPVYGLIDENGEEQKPKSREENGFKFQPCGSGVQDFEKILETAEKCGTEYIIVEQDQSVERPAMEAVKMSRDYLKTLGQ